jgi:hypothetical protein
MRSPISLAMRSLALASLLAVVASAPASADALRRRGSCDGPSDWKLVVRHETSRTLRVRFDIVGGASGQTGPLIHSDNGDR